MTEILGIDLGTTNSAVAIWRDGHPQLIPDQEGNLLTPSVVALDPSTGELVVGHPALQIAVEKPQVAIYSIKRFMGRRFKEDLVREDLTSHLIRYEMRESLRRGGRIEVVVEDKHLTPQEVSAKILQKLKADAEAFLGHPVTQAVITVPAYFHDSQRQATRDAGRLAGLEVKRVLNEPTAACLAFGYEKLKENRQKIAVYDLGGGTFDISILEVGRGPFRVRATNGNTHLGGDDINHLIVEWILSEIGTEETDKLRENLTVLDHLYAISERVKIALSSLEKFPIELGAISDISSTKLTLTRTHLEEMTKNLIEESLLICRRTLYDAHLQTTDIQEVLLVGGQTHMPAIRQAIQDFFDKEPNVTINPEEVVAQGAAIQAAMLAGLITGLRLADVVPLSLGVSSKGRMDVIIARNTSIPVVKTKIFSTADNNQDSVEIQIYQGEGRKVTDNVKLDGFILSGIEPAPAGEAEIEVTFRVDQDGILHVSGKDLRTGNYQETTITDSVKLSEEEIEEMVKKSDFGD